MRSNPVLAALAFAALVGCGGGGGGKTSAVTVPTITTQPAAQTVEVGGSATFSVVATGANLTYQWQKAGTDIAGATTRAYTLSPVALSDSGSYAVVVTNTVDGVSYAATSASATLAVSNTGTGSVTVD